MFMPLNMFGTNMLLRVFGITIQLVDVYAENSHMFSINI